jgi:predicted RecA/RadA family phage recombinase
MLATFIHRGDAINHIPTTDLPMGAVVVQGSLVGIANRPIPAGSLGSLTLEGVFDVPVTPGTTAAVGAPLYWDPATQIATSNAGSGANPPLGVVVQAIAATDTLARVRLNH